jgi:hypothetical protein
VIKLKKHLTCWDKKMEKIKNMISPSIAFRVDGDLLVAHASPGDLGFTPRQVWNPSPSVQHRTEPYDVPKTLHISIEGNAETSAKFSPPPFAVIVENAGQRTFVAVTADPGWHRWNTVMFDTTGDGTRVIIDLEGHTSDATGHVRLLVLPGADDESRHALLRRGLQASYPAAAVTSESPNWWLRPIYCGWGDQVTMAMWLEGLGEECRALAYCLQGLYERWLRRLDEAQVPIGTVIIDAGWSLAGVWTPDTMKWPDLRGFIDHQHNAGRKVLLWLATWLWDGLPDAWCTFAGTTKLTADPTHPDYLAFITDHVQRLLSPDGFNADGFKIDQLAYCPNERRPRGGARFGATTHYPPPAQPIQIHGDGWGCELLHRLQKTIYDAAKRAKPDCLITSSTVHPYFSDTFDMTRLHDTGPVSGDVVHAMKARSDLSRAALPNKPIDTDDWVHSDYEQWLRYTSGSHVLGVPCLFYAERFMANWHAEPATQLIPLADLRRIADAWTEAGM